MNSVQKAAYELIQANVRFLYTLTVKAFDRKVLASIGCEDLYEEIKRSLLSIQHTETCIIVYGVKGSCMWARLFKIIRSYLWQCLIVPYLC